MKFHGRVACGAWGGELEYHDSLHLPRLRASRLLLFLEINQLCIIINS